MRTIWKFLPFHPPLLFFSFLKKGMLVFVLITGYAVHAQENCGNGLDDDHDGKIDCLDPDCKGEPPAASHFNTGTNGSGGVLPGGSADLSWKFSKDYAGPYVPAIVMSSKPASYYASPWPDAEWISISEDGFHSPAAGNVDYYFKTTFLLPCFNPCGLSYLQPGTFCLRLDYFSDNSIYEIWVNGVKQSPMIKTIPVSDPYNNYGFTASGMLAASLCQNWKPGLNEIIIRVSSGPAYMGLLIQSSTKVTPSPTATISGNTTVCQNASKPVITFTGTGEPPFTFSYMINQGSTQTVTTINGNSASVEVPTTTAGRFTYTLIGVKDANTISCSSVSAPPVNVTILPAPNVDAGANQTICEGESVSLAATGGDSYQWINGPATSTYAVTPLSTTTYTVTAKLAGCSATDEVTITVNPRPTISVNPNPAKLCEGKSIALNASGASSYSWSPTKGLSDNTGSIVIASPITTTTYTLTGTSKGCTASLTVAVQVSPSFKVDLGPDTAICEDGSILLNGGHPGAIHLWSTGDTLQQIAVSSPGIYWIAVTEGLCKISDSVSVSLVTNSNPMHDTVLCSDEIVLKANKTGLAYLWSTGKTTPSIIIKDAGRYWLTTTIKNCKITDTIEVEDERATIYAENTFTPNGDGLNDTFTVKSSGLTLFDMKIFNRWGEEIFHTNDLSTGWDGTFNGTPVRDGTYIWIVQYHKSCNGEKLFKQFGHITSLKQ